MAGEVRIERLLPRDIASAVTERPVVYLPLGTYEWHGQHLPVGLDALTAHGVCSRAALRDGGLVCPPLYYGTGGGHALYPWTVMMDDDGAVAALLSKTMHRMKAFGIRLLILFSGHFAPSQLAMIERLADDWNRDGLSLRILALAVNMAPDLPLGPDHAAIFETTLLHALHPELVEINRLPPLKPGELPETNPFGEQRHDPSHPLYGIFGPDPRGFDTMSSAVLLNQIVDWLIGHVHVTLGDEAG